MLLSRNISKMISSAKYMNRPLVQLSLVALFVCLPNDVHGSTNASHVKPICNRCQCLNMVPYSVDCDDMQFEEIPEFRKDLKISWSFQMKGNLLKEITPLPFLANLTTISFSYNYISKIAEAAFANLTHLTSLDISHNLLTQNSFNSEAFRGLFNDSLPDPIPLQTLNLGHNSLSRLPRNAFKHLVNLTSLDLSYNNFIDLSRKTAEAISELRQLRKLDLSFTNLTRLPNHFFAELTHLEELDLSGNLFMMVPSEINYAHALKTLSFNNHRFGYISAGWFWETLNRLETLNLKDSQVLFRIDGGAFGNLSSLRVLKLSGNPQLGTFSPYAFTNNQNETLRLKKLYLENNNLEYLPVSPIQWMDIEYLDLQDNPWNCDCHFEWFAKNLFPVMQRNQFELTVRVTCANPTELMGQRVVNTVVQEHKFVCNDPRMGQRYGFVIIATIVVGTLLLVTGTIIFSYVLFRRAKIHDWIGENVKYKRTLNEDEEIITSTIQY